MSLAAGRASEYTYRRAPAIVSFFDRVAGDVLVLDPNNRRARRFWVVQKDGAQFQRVIVVPSSGLIKFDPDADERIVSVPNDDNHRILWVTGPCATPPWKVGELAAFHPRAKWYLRRLKLARLLLPILRLVSRR